MKDLIFDQIIDRYELRNILTLMDKYPILWEFSRNN